MIPAKDILSFMHELANAGFQLKPNAEVTIEINPGTIDHQRLDLYRAAGINRYSVGVQSFRDEQLKGCGREHTAEQTRKDIELLKEHKLNYSLDLLFGLPHQSKDELHWEIDQFLSYDPPHISAYNLTIPTGHPMNEGRVPDSEQAEMFDILETRLLEKDIHRYELSNFSKPGQESRHNMLYWSDSEYWGLGVSAHSYLKTKEQPLGIRFWNSPVANLYEKQCSLDFVPDPQVEKLATHEALTDYCHTQLRKVIGLNYSELANKFGQKALELVTSRAKQALEPGLIETVENGIRMTSKGRQLANQCFLKFTFLSEDFNIP